MNNRFKLRKQALSVLILSLGLIVLVVFYVLIKGFNFLLHPTPYFNCLPIGNTITALGVVCLSLLVYVGLKKLFKNDTFRIKILLFLSILSLLMAGLWLPISYYLAANLSFTFTEKIEFRGGQLAMRVFWSYNVVLVLLPICIFITGICYWFYIKRKYKK